jgi:hypothetical protein
MQPQLQHAQQQQQQHPTVLTVRPLPPAPSPDAFVSAVSWWAPSAVLLCGTSRGSLFSLATVPPAPKRALSVAEFAPHAVDRLEYVAKWNALLSLSAGRIASHSLGPDGPGAALAPEPPVNTNEVGVVTFCCDVVSDRLCMSMKRRVLVLRRVYASSQAPARFELVNVTEIEGLPRELGWAVERVGVRWLLVGTEDALTWINTDVKTQETPDKLLPASLLHAGRTNDEVLVVRGASASFSAPRELSRGEFDFPSAVASVALCCPFVLGMGATGEVFVHLDSGAAMQVLRVKPIVRFALAACASGGGAGGGSVAFGAGAWGSPLPMADMVPRLLEGALFQQALAVCQARWAPEHAWAADRARAEELRAVASRAYALHLLLQPAGCSAQDVAKAAELLKGLASLHEVLGLFADSDLFASAEEARSCVGDQAELRNVKFRPGALPAALRELLLPLLLVSVECVAGAVLAYARRGAGVVGPIGDAGLAHLAGLGAGPAGVSRGWGGDGCAALTSGHAAAGPRPRRWGSSTRARRGSCRRPTCAPWRRATGCCCSTPRCGRTTRCCWWARARSGARSSGYARWGCTRRGTTSAMRGRRWT